MGSILWHSLGLIPVSSPSVVPSRLHGPSIINQLLLKGLEKSKLMLYFCKVKKCFLYYKKANERV